MKMLFFYVICLSEIVVPDFGTGDCQYRRRREPEPLSENEGQANIHTCRDRRSINF